LLDIFWTIFWSYIVSYVNEIIKLIKVLSIVFSRYLLIRHYKQNIAQMSSFSINSNTDSTLNCNNNITNDNNNITNDNNNVLKEGVALKLNIHAKSSTYSRASTLVLPHGPIRTPVFMPVGTKGTIKGLTTQQLYNPELNPEIILGNTYHLAFQVCNI